MQGDVLNVVDRLESRHDRMRAAMARFAKQSAVPARIPVAGPGVVGKVWPVAIAAARQVDPRPPVGIRHLRRPTVGIDAPKPTTVHDITQALGLLARMAAKKR